MRSSAAGVKGYRWRTTAALRLHLELRTTPEPHQNHTQFVSVPISVDVYDCNTLEILSNEGRGTIVFKVNTEWMDEDLKI